MQTSYTRLRAACYTSSLTTSVIANLSPVLFITFHTLYGVSFGRLGLLVLINFLTQLGVDLLFSFYSHKFNIPLTVRLMPVLAAAGLIVYGIAPLFFPGNVYLGIVFGTVIFSAAAGLAEVLISPVIAAIPAKDPDREMSQLHSVYAWGVVAVIPLSSLFLLAFGKENWLFLPLLFALLPLSSSMLFAQAQIPPMKTPERVSGALSLCRNPALWLCVIMIFFGGAAECTMAQWCSGYLEQALSIPKVWGDLFGAALFGLMLAIGRTLYARYGRNVEKILLYGFASSVLCYIVCALTGSPVVGLLSCALTGFCTSLLWPGSLVVAAERLPQGGVFIYAMMAAGGDLGAAVGPQLMGSITDLFIASPVLAQFAQQLALSPDQLGLKAGLLLAALFPLCGMFIARRFCHKATKK
ncbi:MAG: MFS transporter [Clostridia bacterium]|nr:MFS transporter [Clostridia bacterium]